MRKASAFVVGAFVAGLYGWFVLKDKAEVAEVKEPVTSANSWNYGGDKKPDFNNSKLSDILKNSKKSVEKTPVDIKDEPDLKVVCQNDRQRLAEMTLDEFAEAVKAGKMWFNNECTDLEPEGIRFWAERFYGACSKPAVEKAPDMCAAFGFFMKAQVMFEGLEDKPFNALTDEELVYAFFARMNQPRFDEVVGEMQLRFPESPAVAKAAVAAATMGKKTESEMLDALNSTVGDALEKNPGDDELMALDMFLAVKNKEPGLEDSLKEYNANHPQSGEGMYALAYHAWESGDRGAALKYIDQAIAREPKNKRYQEAKANVLKAKGTEGKAFGFSLGFRPEDF